MVCLSYTAPPLSYGRLLSLVRTNRTGGVEMRYYSGRYSTCISSHFRHLVSSSLRTQLTSNRGINNTRSRFSEYLVMVALILAAISEANLINKPVVSRYVSMYVQTVHLPLLYGRWRLKTRSPRRPTIASRSYHRV